jgi:argininosuccinate lyase
MQEDKEGTFDALHALSLCIAATEGMVRDMIPSTERMKSSAGAGFATATDLADWLVRALGLPFRQAHHVTGSLVRVASEQGTGLEDLSLAQMQSVEPRITAEVFSVLGVDQSVRSRTSYGGTSPANVIAQADRWLAALAS